VIRKVETMKKWCEDCKYFINGFDIGVPPRCANGRKMHFSPPESYEQVLNGIYGYNVSNCPDYEKLKPERLK